MNARWFGMGAAVVVSGCVAWWLILSAPTTVPQPLAERLDGHWPLLPQTPIVSRAFPVTVDAELVAERVAIVRAPADGELQVLRAGDDQSVAAGDELAVISSAELQKKRLDNESKVRELGAMLQLYSPTSNPELRKLKAALDAGKKRYQYAQTSFERLAELFHRGLVSGKEYEDAHIQLEADKLALEAASRDLADAQSMSAANFIKISNQAQAARLEQRELHLNTAALTLSAPFAGQVRRFAPGKNHDGDEWRVGDTIKAGEPLFYLEAPHRMVRMDVAKQMLEYFAEGDTVIVTSHDGKSSREGVVQRIVNAPYEPGASSAIEALAQIRVILPEGAFAAARNRRVRVSKAVEQSGRLVPRDVLLSMGAEQFVYVKRCEDSTPFVTRRRVVASAEENGMALITAGLVSGECIADIKAPPS